MLIYIKATKKLGRGQQYTTNSQVLSRTLDIVHDAKVESYLQM
jgi:hypothetical protein